MKRRKILNMILKALKKSNLLNLLNLQSISVFVYETGKYKRFPFHLKHFKIPRTVAICTHCHSYAHT